MRIKINKIQCAHCKDIIESKFRHDFKSCTCGKVSVDGGRDYLKRSFEKRDDYIELSEYHLDKHKVGKPLSEEEIKNLRPGVPCRHPGCMAHISHPCELCGRIGAGAFDVPMSTFLSEDNKW